MKSISLIILLLQSSNLYATFSKLNVKPQILQPHRAFSLKPKYDLKGETLFVSRVPGDNGELILTSDPTQRTILYTKTLPVIKKNNLGLKEEDDVFIIQDNQGRVLSNINESLALPSTSRQGLSPEIFKIEHGKGQTQNNIFFKGLNSNRFLRFNFSKKVLDLSSKNSSWEKCQIRHETLLKDTPHFAHLVSQNGENIVARETLRSQEQHLLGNSFLIETNPHFRDQSSIKAQNGLFLQDDGSFTQEQNYFSFIPSPDGNFFIKSLDCNSFLTHNPQTHSFTAKKTDRPGKHESISVVDTEEDMTTFVMRKKIGDENFVVNFSQDGQPTLETQLSSNSRVYIDELPNYPGKVSMRVMKGNEVFHLAVNPDGTLSYNKDFTDSNAVWSMRKRKNGFFIFPNLGEAEKGKDYNFTVKKEISSFDVGQGDFSIEDFDVIPFAQFHKKDLIDQVKLSSYLKGSSQELYNISRDEIEGKLPNLDHTLKAKEYFISKLMRHLKNDGIKFWLDGNSLLGHFRNDQSVPEYNSEELSIHKDSLEKTKASLLNFIELNKSDLSFIKYPDQRNKDVLHFVINSFNGRRTDADVIINVYASTNNGHTEQHVMEPSLLKWKYWEVHEGGLFGDLKPETYLGQETLVPQYSRRYLTRRFLDLRPWTLYYPEINQFLEVNGDQYTEQQKKVWELARFPTQRLDESPLMSGGDANHPVRVTITKWNKRKKAVHEVWKKVFLTVEKFLEFNKIPHWVDAGSLIGVYRYKGGAIAPWDHDVDLSIPQAFFLDLQNAINSPEIRKAFLRKFPVIADFRTEDVLKTIEAQDWSNRTLDKVSQRRYMVIRSFGLDGLERVSLDIYNYQMSIDRVGEETNSQVCYNSSYRFTYRYPKWEDTLPASMLFPLFTLPFKGIPVAVPRQTEEYLELRYGKDLSAPKVWDERKQRYVDKADHEYNVDTAQAGEKNMF